MSEASAAAAARIKQLQEENAKRRASAPKAKEEMKVAANDERLAKIQENTFYKIMMGEGTPSEKKAAVKKALQATDDKKADKVRRQEYALYKEWLQSRRELLSMKVIQLTDTETESETQKVFKEIGDGIIEFEDSMEPLEKLLQGLYNLRMAGQTQNALRDIKEENEAKERRAAERAERERKAQEIQDAIKKRNEEIKAFEQERSFFGFGGIKADALAKIAAHSADNEKAQKELEAIAAATEQAALEAQANASTDQKYEADKEQLRTLLNLSSTEHVERKQRLIDAAKNFVGNTKNRVTGVMNHMEGMSNQIDTLFEAGTRIRSQYAILNEATKEAQTENSKLRSTLQVAKENEGEIEKLDREDKLMAVEDHIASIDQAGNDTVSQLAELTAQTGRVKAMKDSNALQMQKTLTLKTAGIAGIADKLAFTLQAVSQAALNESSEMAENSIAHMNKGTTKTITNEVFRVAVGMQEGNKKMAQAIEELEAFGKTMRESTLMHIEGVAEATRLNQEFNEQAKHLQEELKSAMAVHADVADGTAGQKPATPEKRKTSVSAPAGPDPFGL